MARVAEETLDSFRGGLAARYAAMEFSGDQWAKLSGFVLEDAGRLRSQWPLQQVGGLDEVAAVAPYTGHTSRFLVAVRDDGSLWWAEAPDDTLEADSGDLELSWEELEGAGTTAAHRPLCEVPRDDVTGAGFRSTLMLNSVFLEDDDPVVFVYETDAGGQLTFVEEDNLWPTDADEDSAPKGQHAVMWNGVLVLGDVEWRDDANQTFGPDNAKRWRNALWLSEPGLPTSFDPLSVVFVGEAHDQVTGLQPIDAGLLVFTTGGVWILRGTPPDRYSREPLRLGVGAAHNQSGWQHTGTSCWVTEHGDVWQTDGRQVVRVDWQGLGTTVGTEPGEGCAEFGPWMLAQRDGRLFACRYLEDQEGAAWTELNVDALPGRPDMGSSFQAGRSWYMLADGRLFRFTRATTGERGKTPDGWATLTLATRTLEAGGGHRKTFWQRVGLRATAGRDAQVAVVRRIVLRAGPALDDGVPRLDRDGPWQLMDQARARRFQALVRGAGAANEMSVEVQLEGDVTVEQVAVTVRGALLRGDVEGR